MFGADLPVQDQEWRSQGFVDRVHFENSSTKFHPQDPWQVPQPSKTVLHLAIRPFWKRHVIRCLPNWRWRIRRRKQPICRNSTRHSDCWKWAARTTRTSFCRRISIRRLAKWDQLDWAWIGWLSRDIKRGREGRGRRGIGWEWRNGGGRIRRELIWKQFMLGLGTWGGGNWRWAREKTSGVATVVVSACMIKIIDSHQMYLFQLIHSIKIHKQIIWKSIKMTTKDYRFPLQK